MCISYMRAFPHSSRISNIHEWWLWMQWRYFCDVAGVRFMPQPACQFKASSWSMRGMRGHMKAALSDVRRPKDHRAKQQGGRTNIKSTNQTRPHFRVCSVKCAHMVGALGGMDAADVSREERTAGDIKVEYLIIKC